MGQGEDRMMPDGACDLINFILGAKVTQYWRKAAAVGPDLVCAVNGRFAYWTSDRPIPGGIAFENVELREPFK